MVASTIILYYVTDCELKRLKDKGLECTATGEYKPKQCFPWGTSELCWCVNPLTGKFIKGSDKIGKDKVTCNQAGGGKIRVINKSVEIRG